MIDRARIFRQLEADLKYYPAVGIVGARQVGKTTLVRQIVAERPKEVTYLDLQLPSKRQLLTDAESYLRAKRDQMVVLDEVQTMPELFPILRGLIDEDRRPGRFCLLGSAAPELLRSTAESLAGRISYTELQPFAFAELGDVDPEVHWLRGGYPVAYLTDDGGRRTRYFRDYLQTFVGTDLRDLAGGADPEGMRRLVIMLTHLQGQTLNISQLSRSLGVATTTINRYLDVLAAAFLIRIVRPYLPNLRKRLTKAPKVFLRDSGFLHGLLDIETFEGLLTHPVVGGSWEGYVGEQLRSVLGAGVELFHYRTAKQHEIDYVCHHPKLGLLGFEVKRSNAPSLSASFYTAVEDIGPDKVYVVTPSTQRHPIGERVEVLGLREVLSVLTR